MKIIVTGSGGFLGGYIVKELLKNKDNIVTGMGRHIYGHLEPLEEANPQFRQIRCDVTDKAEVLEKIKDADAVIHSASIVAMWGKWDDFYKTNVIGTQNVIDACLLNKIPHLLYTSSPSVVFGNESLENIDESQDYPNESFSLYGKSKAIAEKRVLKINGARLKTVALRPHLIFGKGDQNLLPRVIEKAKRGRLKIVGRGENLVDVLYVENAAIAHVQALSEMIKNDSVCGRAYFLGQERPVVLWDFINGFLTELKIPPVTKKISSKFAFKLGLLFEKIYGFLGIYKSEPPMTRFVALQLSHSHYFNHQSSHKLLKIKYPYTLDQGIEETKKDLR
jgi:2-alkyl-3-oxoalkanoate reductase